MQFFSDMHYAAVDAGLDVNWLPGPGTLGVGQWKLMSCGDSSVSGGSERSDMGADEPGSVAGVGRGARRHGRRDQPVRDIQSTGFRPLRAKLQSGRARLL